MTKVGRGPLRSIVSGSIGNLVEWYDWYVYSAFSVYFAERFFPKADATASLLNTAAIFAVGFLMRPVGGWLMGVVADRYGRKRAMVASVLLMSAGSLSIALCPTYDQIGVGAPLLLLLARLVQGLSVGGEYGTSATYLSEMAGARHRGFWSSFQYVTLVAGQLVALAVLVVLQRFVLDEAQLHAWGWRIPFAIGAAGAWAALWLRSGMEETPDFTTLSTDRKRGMSELLSHPREIALVVGLTLGGTVAFYTYTTYAQKFLSNTAGFSKADAALVSAASLFVFMCLQPVFGALSDRIGRRRCLLIFGIGGLLFTVPLMRAVSRATTPFEAWVWIMCALVLVSSYTSISAVVKAELFPAQVRALGVGLPYALTVSVFGGTAEYVALSFKQQGHEELYYWYVTGCIAVSLVTYAFMRDTRAHSRMSAQ